MNGHDCEQTDLGGNNFLAAEVEALAFECAGMTADEVRSSLETVWVPEFATEAQATSFFTAVLRRKSEIESATRQQ